jgi:thiol-disulfide isomerase/thioredoxin
MKPISAKILLLAIALFLKLNVKAQYPSDRSTFFDSLKTFWSNEKLSDKAAKWAIEYYKKWASSFPSKIDQVLAPILNSKTHETAESKFIDKLFSEHDSLINEIITPIYLWNKVHISTDRKESSVYLKKFMSYIRDTANYFNRTERFGLMILRDLKLQKFDDSSSTNNLKNKIKSNLEKFTNLDRTDVASGSMTAWQRHWFRALYAYMYYQQYLNDINDDSNLMHAVHFSPDFIDKPFNSEITFELSLLFSEENIPNYNSEYFNLLNQKHSFQKALNHITDVTLGEPSNENMALLKASYTSNKLNDSFADYWKKKVESMMKLMPELVITFNNDKTVDFSKPTEKWNYIDVWATWCPPCVKELPDIELYYQSTIKNPNSKLELFTMSVNSKDLKNYISKHNYTFPVSEINESVTKKLGIEAFPTKYLVSPNRKYLELPHGNWQEFIKNYCLLD